MEELTNRELQEKYDLSKDLQERVEINKERFSRAYKLLEDYPVVTRVEWGVVYNEEKELFYLVNDSLGVLDKNTLRNKLLIDAIVFKTTSPSGHNFLLENLTNENLAKVNALLIKITGNPENTLTLQQLKAYTLFPCFLRSGDIEELKKERKVIKNENSGELQVNTEPDRGDYRQETDRPNRMVDRRNSRYRSNDNESSSDERRSFENQIRKPYGADVFDSDNQDEWI